MTEERLAELIVQNALKYHDESTGLAPSLVLDKEDYADFDFDIVKEHLKEYGFTIIEGRDAPPPFSEMDEDFKSRKWFAYQDERL